jgi:hypothetical protein
MNHASLNKTLTQRCGTGWELRFRVKDLNIDETVHVTVPRLLDERTIKAIRDQSRANRTYLHGSQQSPYLFGGMVFCAACGYTMNGQTNERNRRYYRHGMRNGARECTCRPRPWVRADELEVVVMHHLFECFGNPVAVQRAIDAATPNLEKMRQYREDRARCEAGLGRTNAGRQRILKLVANDQISDAEVEQSLKELADQETRYRAELARLDDALQNVPTPEGVRAVADRVSARFGAEYRLANHSLERMTWEEQRALAQMVFCGELPDGRRMGIYIEFVEGQTSRTYRQWRYTIHGHLIHDRGQMPMSKARLDALFTFGAPWEQSKLVAQNATP